MGQSGLRPALRNPEAYLAATLRKILDQHMQSDIDGLMPWNFAK